MHQGTQTPQQNRRTMVIPIRKLVSYLLEQDPGHRDVFVTLEVGDEFWVVDFKLPILSSRCLLLRKLLEIVGRRNEQLLRTKEWEVLDDNVLRIQEFFALPDS